MTAQQGASQELRELSHGQSDRDSNKARPTRCKKDTEPKRQTWAWAWVWAWR